MEQSNEASSSVVREPEDGSAPSPGAGGASTGSGEPAPKTSRLYLGAVAVPTLAGIAASATLLVEYLRPAPVFCDPGGGCEALKATSYAWHFGIPTPAFGLAGFVALAVLAMLRGGRARAAHLLVATLAAVVGIYFVSVQAKLGTYCKFCLVADGSAMLVALVAMARSLRELEAPRSRVATWGSVAALALAVVVPTGVGSLKKAKIPPVIAAEIDKTPPGQVTVVDFVDFQCPYCRMTNEVFEPIVAAHKDKIRLVRKQVPLAMHSHAHDAARAACCGDQLGKGDAVAEALFTSDDLTPEGCEKIAVAAGLDPAAYRACIADPKTEARIQSDTTEFHDAHGRGLPTIWIDRQKLEGAQPAAALSKAVERALADQS